MCLHLSDCAFLAASDIHWRPFGIHAGGLPPPSSARYDAFKDQNGFPVTFASSTFSCLLSCSISTVITVAKTAEEYGEVHLLNGRMFRLRTEILAIATEPNGKKLAVTIPAGEMFKVLSCPSTDDPTMFDVTWNKAALEIFADDIEQRWVEVLVARTNH